MVRTKPAPAPTDDDRVAQACALLAAVENYTDAHRDLITNTIAGLS